MQNDTNNVHSLTTLKVLVDKEPDWKRFIIFKTHDDRNELYFKEVEKVL